MVASVAPFYLLSFFRRSPTMEERGTITLTPTTMARTLQMPMLTRALHMQHANAHAKATTVLGARFVFVPHEKRLDLFFFEIKGILSQLG